MNPYTNLTEALEGLICQGYDINFVTEKDFINARNHSYKISMDEIEIHLAYHFTDPDPKLDAIICGIFSKKYHIKGLVIMDYPMITKHASKELKS